MSDDVADSWAGCLKKIEVLEGVCVCVCNMSGINSYYHDDNVNYSQPIKPEECQFIHLAAAQLRVCVCVCLFPSDLVQSAKFSP